MYELLFSPAAERYFKKLKEKPLKEAFKAALLEIKENPYVGSPKKGDLTGYLGYDVYYGKTNYEIAYAIRETNEKKVIIVLAGTREDFYHALKRYVNNSDSILKI